MRVLLVGCSPRKLKQHLAGHDVFTVPEMGWAGIKNGALLCLVEPALDVFVTLAGNLPYQQSLRFTNLAFIGSWFRLSC